jgi:hypothetical protein
MDHQTVARSRTKQPIGITVHYEEPGFWLTSEVTIQRHSQNLAPRSYRLLSDTGLDGGAHSSSPVRFDTITGVDRAPPTHSPNQSRF